MFKKAVSFILCAALLFMVPVAVSAANESVLLTLCNSIAGFGATQNADYSLADGQTQDEKCICFDVDVTSHKQIYFYYTPSEAVDASSCSHIELDLYLSITDFIIPHCDSQLEITSSGSPDVAECAFNIMATGLTVGWNHISLPLSSGTMYSATAQVFDSSKINYMRFYANIPEYAGDRIVIKLDNIFFTDGNGGSVTTSIGKDSRVRNPASGVSFGDLNGGGVNASDALLVLQYSVDKAEFNNSQLIKADVDNNSVITATDALCILQKSVEKIKWFPAEETLTNYYTNKTETGIKGAHVVHTEFYTQDSVVAVADVFAFGASGDGVTDDYYAFQAALDYAEALGGGVIFAPVGHYVISRALRIANGVTLRGDAPEITNDDPAAAEGTVLYAYTGRNDPDGKGFLQLYSGACIKNLGVYYPEQDAGNITPYSYTIEQKEQYGINVENVYLYNSYNGIKMGPNINALQNIRGVAGTVLSNGIFLDYNVDICRMENIHFSPEYWIKSGLCTISNQQEESLRDYNYKNSVGVLLRHIDWVYLSDLYVDGAAAAVFTEKTKREGQSGSPNGQIYNINVTNCNVGLQAEFINPIGFMITKGTINAVTPIICGGEFCNTLTLNSLELNASGEYGIFSYGNGYLTMQKCTVNTQYSAAKAGISIEKGGVSIAETSFSGHGVNVQLSENSRASKAVNCMKTGELTVTDPSGLIKCTYDTDYICADFTAPDYNAGVITRPSGDGFIDFSQYNLPKDGSTDISKALQAAIDNIYERGGGTVYIEAGEYLLSTPITVREGVEIRGSCDSPAHTHIRSTVIYTDYGKNGTTQDTALFTLKAKAGLSGFKVVYISQGENNVIIPYAYTVRGMGMGVYIRNVVLVNPYHGVDFQSARCDGHVINGLAGSPFKVGVACGGGSKAGIVRDVQFNPHYHCDNPFYSRVSIDANTMGVIAAIQMAQLEGFIIGDAPRLIHYNNFVYGANSGLVIDAKADAFVLGHGTDGGNYSLTARGTLSNKVTLVNSQLVSISTDPLRCYINIEDSFNGSLDLIQTNMWGNPVSAVEMGNGNVNISQGTVLRNGTTGIHLAGGNLSLSGMCFMQTDSQYDIFAESGSSLFAFANAFSAAVKKAKTDAVIKSSDF